MAAPFRRSSPAPAFRSARAKAAKRPYRELVRLLIITALAVGVLLVFAIAVWGV